MQTCTAAQEGRSSRKMFWPRNTAPPPPLGVGGGGEGGKVSELTRKRDIQKGELRRDV